MVRTIATMMLLVLLPWRTAYATPAGVHVLSQPRPATDFSLRDSRGAEHRLSDYRGSVVIVNFWATWCVPCRREMPSLRRAWGLLGDERVVVLALSMDESWEPVRAYLEQNPLEFPVLMDHNGEVAAQWRVMGVPTAYVLDGEGMRRIRVVGGYEWDQPRLIEEIRRLLPPDSGRDPAELPREPPRPVDSARDRP